MCVAERVIEEDILLLLGVLDFFQSDWKKAFQFFLDRGPFYIFLFQMPFLYICLHIKNIF